MPEISDVARKLAGLITPPLVDLANSMKPGIIQGASFLVKPALKLAYPFGVKQIPPIAEAGTNALLDKFAQMSIGDLAAKLVEHARQSGIKAHPTLIDQRYK